MSISPAQCRAARALIGWSQDVLEENSHVSKKTIADFERGVKYPQIRTNEALQRSLETGGIIFISQGEDGEGVRLRSAEPKLSHRNDVPLKNWVAFAFHYKRERAYIGFITYPTLASIALNRLKPLEVFDRDCDRILACAAHKVEVGDFGHEDYAIMIQPEDLPPIEFRAP